MGNTDNDTDGAAARLHHLQQYYREHPVTGPLEGHAPVVNPGAPLSLATLDHISASVREVAEHTRALNPHAGPVPAEAAAVYDWCREHTEHADDIDRQGLEVIEYRQYLEHAVRAGDHKVVRRHRCPKCGTWGLMWQPDMQRALCTNTGCVDRDGFSTTVPLARLAYEHVVGRKNLRRVSTT
jgi:hypothetical protein